ncbi:MAG TPA: Clp protease N-terminal domain-containing protein, partial [Armatimonadota bacterium]|nr:Clp protease N-terminal domain-containing protein [Armatimonadota bacterium]
MGTEHLLLGILDEPDSMAARVLETLAGSLDSIRLSTVSGLPAGSKNPATKIGRTRSARRVLELAEDEATQQGA